MQEAEAEAAELRPLLGSERAVVAGEECGHLPWVLKGIIRIE